MIDAVGQLPTDDGKAGFHERRGTLDPALECSSSLTVVLASRFGPPSAICQIPTCRNMVASFTLRHRLPAWESGVRVASAYGTTT
jgi:hypothetical protein